MQRRLITVKNIHKDAISLFVSTDFFEVGSGRSSSSPPNPLTCMLKIKRGLQHLFVSSNRTVDNWNRLPDVLVAQSYITSKHTSVCIRNENQIQLGEYRRCMAYACAY